jgi:hypothetical protein
MVGTPHGTSAAGIHKHTFIVHDVGKNEHKFGHVVREAPDHPDNPHLRGDSPQANGCQIKGYDKGDTRWFHFMRKKSPYRNTRELAFSAPFSLQGCERCLRSKHERRRKSWWANLIDPSTEVYVRRMNADTFDFHIVRGSAIVSGRLDRLDDDSTWVSAQARQLALTGKSVGYLSCDFAFGLAIGGYSVLFVPCFSRYIRRRRTCLERVTACPSCSLEARSFA